MCNGTGVEVVSGETTMFSRSRRLFLQRLLGFSLLGGMFTPIVLAGDDKGSSEKLLMVNGWVILESDLR